MRVVILILGLMLAGCSSAPVTPEGTVMSGEGCQSPLGFIPEGRTMNGYRQAVAQGGANCEPGPLTCINGQWSGAYIYPSCTRLP